MVYYTTQHNQRGFSKTLKLIASFEIALFGSLLKWVLIFCFCFLVF